MTVHTLPSISRSKGNQAMKFDRFIKVTWEIIFFKS